MKTIEDNLNSFAKNKGYENWNALVSIASRAHLKDYFLEAMQEHAKQVAEAQRELDIQNAEIKQESEYIGSLIGYAMVSRVDEDSIRNQPLVTDNI